MFETTKLPTEQRTVTGNSVSFNTHYALPLDACKITFEATQSGSGDPSPTNIRPISGVSSITFGANGSATVIDLDGTRYGGTVDLLSGVAHITDYIPDLTNASFFRGNKGGGVAGYYFATSDWYSKQLPHCSIDPGGLNLAKTKEKFNYGTIENPYNHIGNFAWAYSPDSSSTVIRISLDGIETLEDFNAIKSNLKIKYPLATPIEIHLSDLPTLTTIAGNNTFSTDTGSLEISFQDLQEKSASGAVATFNTALAMSLPSCNIAINAWQEGSGDPSPSNVRAIHGFSALNMTKAGKNLCVLSSDKLKRTNGNPPIIYGDNSVTIDVNVAGSYWGIWGVFQVQANMVGLRLYFSGNISSGLSNSYVRLVSSDNDGFIGTENNKTVLNSGYTIRNSDIGYYFGIIFYNTTGSPQTISNIQLEVGSQATAYEPYVTPTIYTKALGETVYGGSYNSVTGDKTINRIKIALDSLNWNYNANGKLFSAILQKPAKDIRLTNDLVPMCDIFKGIRMESEKIDGSIMNGYTDNYLFQLIIYTTSITSKEQLDEIIQGHEVVYTIRDNDRVITQIGSTEISTIAGNNTIFADTGDIDLTYKDCDLAKHGDFRQVFEIPD